MFARRSALRWPDRVRRTLWPHIGWARALKYRLHRIARLPGTPHTIAAGLACGVAVSITPLFGLHMLLAAVLALLCRGNIAASVAGTFFANPWTMPLIWLATLRLGSWMLFGDANAAVGAEGLSDTVAEVSRAIRARDVGVLESEVWPLLLSMTVGSLPLAVAAWCLTYWPVRHLVERRRAARLRLRRSHRPL